MCSTTWIWNIGFKSEQNVILYYRPHICHKYHKLYLWRKNCHVENFQLSMYDDCREIKKFSTCGEISDVFPCQPFHIRFTTAVTVSTEQYWFWAQSLRDHSTANTENIWVHFYTKFNHLNVKNISFYPFWPHLVT